MTTGKGPEIATPTPFDGNRAKARQFKNECKLYMQARQRDFIGKNHQVDNVAKIAFVLSYMKEGIALSVQLHRVAILAQLGLVFPCSVVIYFAQLVVITSTFFAWTASLCMYALQFLLVQYIYCIVRVNPLRESFPPLSGVNSQSCLALLHFIPLYFTRLPLIGYEPQALT
jgi:hypothetical protein